MTAPPPGPALVAMNHASWWDPMVALVLTEHIGPDRSHYAPMDEIGLKQYPILEWVGLFGVEPESARGGVAFLRRSSAVLARSGGMLWITPQGRFVDVRDRPIRFAEGLGRLLHRSKGISVATMGLEYSFWNDRLPEVLVRLGAWDRLEDGSIRSAEDWTRRLEESLASVQDGLAESGRSRDPGRFETLIDGSKGVGGIYDLGRRLRSFVRGERFEPEHQVHPPNPERLP